MLNQLITRLSAAALALVLTACAAPAPPPPVEVRRGVIEQITPTQIVNGNHVNGAGAIIGTVVGVGIGSLIGGGAGRTAAMIVGGVGGAVAGNEVQKRNEQPTAGQQIIVRTSAGVLVSVTQVANQRLFVGQRVFIQGNGDGAVVTPE